ncbi:MAG TPA: VOC family protein [Chloroflexota bacterium]|nr:VOC family protein [Chloroflexota bacterium]
MARQNGVTVQGLIHWAIPVNDLADSIRFYTQVLGMEDGGPVGDRMHCVRFAGTDVLLCRLDSPQDPRGPRNGSVHIAFRVAPEDFDNAAAHMREWGVDVQRPTGPPATIRGDVEHRAAGTFVGRSLYFNDPSGNRLEIHDPAAAP